MQVTIQVTDGNSNPVTANATQSPAVSVSDTSANANNGGAAAFNQGDNAPIGAASSGVADMGGPPQWLVDGLSKLKAPVSAAEPAASEGTDAGDAPSF